MIIGGGFLAKNLQRFELDQLPIYIVAAGVGNSQCCDPIQFQREIDFLYSCAAASEKSAQSIIYISSVVANSKSPYALHKRNCEDLIITSAPSYCIIRVPQLIGMYQSAYSLVGYLSKHIYEGLEFDLLIDQRRNIIGVETIADFIKYWSLWQQNQVVTLCNPNNIGVRDLVLLLESAIEKKAKYRARDSDQSQFNVQADPNWCELVALGVREPESYSNLVQRYVKDYFYYAEVM